MKLTDMKCRNARASDRPYKMADGGGLYLYVAKHGARLWRLDYRFNAKRQTMSIGPYPEVSLVQAREARETARKQLRVGLSPMEERKVARVSMQVTRASDNRKTPMAAERPRLVAVRPTHFGNLTGRDPHRLTRGGVQRAP